MWPVVRLALEPAIGALEAAGPDAAGARFEARQMNPRDVFAQLARAS